MEPVRTERVRAEESAPPAQPNPWEKHPAPAEPSAPAERPAQTASPAPQPAPPPAPKAEEPLKPQSRGVQVMLNGKLLSLPGKEDDAPYYVMDLLDFSGIDFEHLDRGVELQVNGSECAFTQELRPQDDVVIRYLE